MEPNVKEMVISLWQEGKSSGQISESLNITRNSVMGIIHRAKRDGLNLRSGPQTVLKNKTPIKEKLKPVIKKVAIIETEKLQLEQKPEKGKILDDLRHGDCRYIISMHDTYGAVYCSDPIEKVSYCDAHARICYITPSR